MDVITNHYQLKRPCSNCPFRKKGAIYLVPGRLEGIIKDITDDDTKTFYCHKTVHHNNGGEWDDDNNYNPSGNEMMCAGAAAYLMKIKQPTVGMRIAFVVGAAKVNDWDDTFDEIIEPINIEESLKDQ